jgi:hypothetical protein
MFLTSRSTNAGCHGIVLKSRKQRVITISNERVFVRYHPKRVSDNSWATTL